MTWIFVVFANSYKVLLKHEHDVWLRLWHDVIWAEMFYSQEGGEGSMNESHTAQLSQWHVYVACARSFVAVVHVCVCVCECFPAWLAVLGGWRIYNVGSLLIMFSPLKLSWQLLSQLGFFFPCIFSLLKGLKNELVVKMLFLISYFKKFWNQPSTPGCSSFKLTCNECVLVGNTIHRHCPMFSRSGGPGCMFPTEKLTF